MKEKEISKENIVDDINDMTDEEKKELLNDFEKHKEKKAKKQSSFQIKLLAFSIIFLFFFKVILLHGIIPSKSMEPTIMKNDFIIVNRLSYKNKTPNRGEIVVFKDKNKDHIIKRVIGTGGDIVEIKDSNVYVNDKKIKEDYIMENSLTNHGSFNKYKVPKGSLFLLGDNRENSYDSRYWDDPYVKEEKLVGKFLFKYNLPFNNVISIKEYKEIQGDD